MKTEEVEWIMNFTFVEAAKLIRDLANTPQAEWMTGYQALLTAATILKQVSEENIALAQVQQATLN
jgi:ferritin-like protein